MASNASAQSNPARNLFFGFDYVLHPIAIKWTCGGERDQDLAALNALLAAFPEDAKRADLHEYIDYVLEIPTGEEGIAELLGGALPNAKVEKLCRAARLLSISWVTPARLKTGREDGVPPEQEVAWAEFWKVVEESN